MGMWDEWMKNMPKGFRFVALASDSMDVMSLLQGKTPDQIADEKTRDMTENDELSQFSEFPFVGFDPLFMENFQLDSGGEDEILDGNDGFFDNLGDLIGNTAGKFKVGAEDLTDNILNIILDQFDEQTSGEKFGDIDPTMLTPEILAQITAEDEAKRQAKESGEFWKDTPLGGMLGGLEGIEQKIGSDIVATGQNIGSAIGDVGAFIGSKFAPPTAEEFLNQIPSTALSPQGRRPIGQDKINQLHTLLDPNDPAATGEILEDLANMSAEGVLNSDIIRAWIESPQFGRGLDSGDVRRLYGTLDSLIDQITPLMDHLDQRAQGINIGGSDSKWEALVRSDVFTDPKIVSDFKKALQTGGPPGGIDTGGHPHPMFKGSERDITTLEQPAGTETNITTLEYPGPGTSSGAMNNLFEQGSDAATAGHPSREMTQDELMQQITYLSDAEDATLETTLEEVFYTTAFQMKNAGRIEVRRELPGLFTTTSILFELYNPDVHQIFPNDEEGRPYDDPDWTGVAGKKKWDVVGKAFGAFLNDFLQPGGRAKYMGQLQESIETLNTYLARGEQGDLYRGSTGFTDMDVWANAVMTKPGYLRNLAKLYSTGGKMGYTSSRIHGYLDELADYWEKMGMSETEIFRKLTARQTEQQDDTDADRILDGTGEAEMNLNINPTLQTNGAWGTTSYGTGAIKGDMDSIIDSGRSDEKVLHDAISANLRMTGRGSVDSGAQPDPRVGYQAVKGLSSEHLDSMPLAFNDAENAKKMKGLPYIQLYVKNGKRVKGTTFVPTKGWTAGAGTVRRKERLMEELRQA